MRTLAMMSVPRLGWNETWGCIMDAVKGMGIPVITETGVFWSQALDRMFDRAIDGGAKDEDAILVLDYDSLFKKWQLANLMDHFDKTPSLDALAPVQAMRNSNVALGLATTGHRDETGFLPAQSAHFGMTLIRVGALRRTARPWFWSQPDSNGKWIGADKIDPDLWFWKQWHMAGNKCHIDQSVRIGHLENRVASVKGDGSIEYISVEDWHERNERTPTAELPRVSMMDLKIN
jgi:hypothetical protein